MKLGLLTLALVSLGAHAELAPHIPGELIVKFKNGQGNFLKEKSVQNNLLSYEVLTRQGHLRLKLNRQKANLEELIQEWSLRDDILYVEPNFIYTIDKPFQSLFPPHKDYGHSGVTNDPRLNALWGLHNTGTNEPGTGSIGVVGADAQVFDAWPMTVGSKAVKVAVIDTGVDYNHEDLSENMWTNWAEKNGQPGVDDDGNGYVDDIHGYDFANDDGDPMDGNGHGTHCAGTIGAVHNNGLGVAGVMGDVSIVALKFLTDQGGGSTADAIKAIEYAISADVDIMSNSWGGGGESQALKEVIEKAADAGIVFTAAAGNSGSDNDDRPQYPANYDVRNVISVAAHTASDQLASFSCYGKETVHIAAPGHNILSTYKNGDYAILSGTSMATPHVSGALGLLIASEGRLELDELRERVMATSVAARGYRSKVKSGGRLSTVNLLRDERPVRVGPDAGAWKTLILDEPFESEHPYGVNIVLKKRFSVPGAKYMRVVIRRFEFEERYDYLQIQNAKGEEVERITLSGQDYQSEYVEGDSLQVTFRADRSVAEWGFIIEEIQYQ